MDIVHCRDADLRIIGWLRAPESRAAAHNGARCDDQADYGPTRDDSARKSQSFDAEL